MVVLLAIVVAFAVAAALHGGSPRNAADRSAAAKRAVIFLLDGVSPAALTGARTPNIDALARAGTSYRDAWIGQAESVGPVSGATIGTGAFPRTHGVVGLVWRDPSTSQATRPTQLGQVLLGSLEQVMEAHHPVPIAALLKDRSPGAAVLAVAGSDCATADAAASWLADYVVCIARHGRVWAPVSVAGHSLPAADAPRWSQPVARGRGLGPRVEGWRLGAQDDRVARTAITAIQRTHAALTIVGFPEYAQVVPFAPAATRQSVGRTILSGIDRDIGLIEAGLRRRGLFDRTVFVITSPSVLTAIQRVVPRSALSDAVVAAGGLPAYIDARGSAVLGLQGIQQAQPVAQTLQAERLAGVDAIYFRAVSRGASSYQPQYLNPRLPGSFAVAMNYLLGTVASSSAPDVVAVYAPGAGSRPPSAGTAPAAVTGSLQWEGQHIPLILSGQGIAPGVSTFPARLVDLAPTLETDLGLTPGRADGAVLADSLLLPPSGATDAEKRLGRHLRPVVSALKNRAAGPSG